MAGLKGVPQEEELVLLARHQEVLSDGWNAYSSPGLGKKGGGNSRHTHPAGAAFAQSGSHTQRVCSGAVVLQPDETELPRTDPLKVKSTQEEEREGNEGEGSKLERPGGSEQEKTEGDKEISDGEEEISEGDEEISEGDEEKEESVRDEEEAQDSERGTEAGSDQEEEDDRDEEGRPAIPPGPHGFVVTF
ncbi:hypothetical protein E1301_Tti006334 [Triplophysa tibetana]|uniref:Uncharacterized protein n=1 Tax=Triplophysa tibetana TaxID=1572043 RepID=A0A5A9NQM7_9TELE|nr:hypothetical protein E1301_Tti006334 [Triplophysa tibetana]